MTQWLSQCGRADLRCGDSLQVMPTLAPDSVDAIVTDPPYGLTFMGKEWDRGVPGVEFWREAYRVAKPGAHLLAFGGTRTYHRQTCAIEDAGWEIRDCIMWVYGSGFPKSLDVSKAIDKCNGQPDRLHRFTAWMRSTGLTARQLDQITDTNMGGHYLTDASQPAIPTAALWELIRPHCGDVPAWVDELVQRIEAEREVVGPAYRVPNAKAVNPHFVAIAERRADMPSTVSYAPTAPATDAARKWSGWGTALKPSHEPIVWATKPLTLVPIDVILQAESNIGSLICLSLSHAKHAESLLRSSPYGLAGAAGSALLIAAAHRGLSSGELSGVMAMFKSPETAKTIWSIVESWSGILAAVSERQNTFTTSTVSKTTTALKTFNCLISEIIREVITPDGERKLGWFLSAPIVETSSSGASAKPARSTSVRDVVSLLTEQNIASIAESSFMPAARAGSSVLQDAITSTAASISPAAELICVARKPLQGTVVANVMKYGTGAINVDGCRIPNLTGQRPDDTLIAWEQEKNLCDLCAKRAGSPAKPVTPATRGTSAGSRAEPTTSAKGVNDLANTGKEITGCSAGLFRAEQASDQTEDSNLSIEESGRMPTAQSRQATKYTTSTETGLTTDLRTCSACGCLITALHTKGSMPASKNATPNTPAAQGIAVPSGRWPSNLIHDGSDEVVDGFPQDGESSAARFFYCAKADGEDREHGNTHPTVKPNDLMRYLIKLIAPKDALILDPFMGSGSTGVAAIQMHNRFIGIELGDDHFEICKRRVEAAFDTFPLLNPKGDQ